MAQEKSCNKCNILKPMDSYHKSSAHKDGKYPTCKQCHSLHRKEYRKNPEVKEREREYLRVYRANNTNRQKNAEAWKRWRDANLDESRRRSRLGYQKRRALKLTSESRRVTTDDARRILALPCVNCGSRENIQIDHIVPLSRGGRHAIGNLQALCSFCNLSKNNSLQIEWKMRQLQVTKLKEVSL